MRRRLERPKVSPGQAGFTLIELLVVVAIIAIGAAIALPAIADYIKNYKINGAAQQVAGEINHARNLAIGKNVNLGVVFMTLSPTTYQYVIEDDMNVPPAYSTYGARPALTALAADANQAGAVRSLPDLIQFSTPAPNDSGFRFNRLGSWCDPGSSTLCGPDLGAGQNFVVNGVNGATMQIRETTTGLTRTISVSNGGRVTVTTP